MTDSFASTLTEITTIPGTVIWSPGFSQPLPVVRIDPALYIGIGLVAAALLIAKLEREIGHVRAWIAANDDDWKTNDHLGDLCNKLKSASRDFGSLYTRTLAPRVIHQTRDRAQIVMVAASGHSVTRHLHRQGDKWTGYDVTGKRIVEYRLA